MRYENVREGVFLKRPNRFIAEVMLDGEVEMCHVKNTGRLGELLIPGVKAVVCRAKNEARKTRYDLIGVYKGEVLYNIDSNAPNEVFGEYIHEMFEDVKYIKAECRYKSSRFDFYVEYADKKAFIEIKGVTKEVDGVMLFPDAPTMRGIKHINELAECVKDGIEAYAVFVIQADRGRFFTPDEKSHSEFKTALKNAAIGGVKVCAFRCRVEEDSLKIKEEMEVRL